MLNNRFKLVFESTRQSTTKETIEYCYNLLLGYLVATGDNAYRCDSANVYLFVDRAFQLGRPYLQ